MKKIVKLLFRNFHYKVLAFIFAFLLWFLAVKQETVVSTFSIPIEIKVPKNFYVVNYEPKKLTVEIEGSKRSVNLLKREGKIYLKVFPKKTGETFFPARLADIMIVPNLQDVSVHVVDNRKLKVKVEKLSLKLIPVKVVLSGRKRKLFYVKSVVPNYVSIYLPESKKSLIKTVKTESINVDAVSDRVTVVLKLVSPFRVFPDDVTVTIERRR